MWFQAYISNNPLHMIYLTLKTLLNSRTCFWRSASVCCVSMALVALQRVSRSHSQLHPFSLCSNRILQTSSLIHTMQQSPPRHLTVAKLAKKFPVIYVTQRLPAVFKTPASSAASSYPTSWTSVNALVSKTTSSFPESDWILHAFPIPFMLHNPNTSLLQLTAWQRMYAQTIMKLIIQLIHFISPKHCQSQSTHKT